MDCSEINLRVKRLRRSDDHVNDALITLDRLGRQNTLDEGLNDLKNGRPVSSLNVQAIASGILESAPTDPTELEGDIKIETGAIIAPSK